MSKDKQLAKRLIQESVEELCERWGGLLDVKAKKKLVQDTYCRFLAGLITLEDIRKDLNPTENE